MVSRPGNIETPIWGNPLFKISFRRWRLFLKKLDFLTSIFNNGLTLSSVLKVIFVFKYAFYDAEKGFEIIITLALPLLTEITNYGRRLHFRN